MRGYRAWGLRCWSRAFGGVAEGFNCQDLRLLKPRGILNATMTALLHVLAFPSYDDGYLPVFLLSLL